MLTNPCDVFRNQSRSPNMVPFHVLGIVSSCAIVTLSLRRAVIPILDFKKCRDLETWVRISQGHWKCHHAIERIRLPIDVLVTMALSRVISEIFNVEKCHLEIGVKGHSRSLKVVLFDILYMVSYQCTLVILSLKYTVFEIFDL